MRQADPGSHLVLIGGPAGAGKTTLAGAWCASRPRAAHIQLDHVRSLIVSGLAHPQGGGPEAGAQYALAVRACCRLAEVYLDAGYDVAIDDVLEPDTFERIWRPALADRKFSLLIVLPSLDATLQRARRRDKRVREDIIRAQHAACARWHEELRLDTTGLNVDESLGLAQGKGLLP